MALKAKKPEINWVCLEGKKQAIKEVKKISQEGEEEEEEMLIYIYFMKG